MNLVESVLAYDAGTLAEAVARQAFVGIDPNFLPLAQSNWDKYVFATYAWVTSSLRQGRSGVDVVTATTNAMVMIGKVSGLSVTAKTFKQAVFEAGVALSRSIIADPERGELKFIESQRPFLNQLTRSNTYNAIVTGAATAQRLDVKRYIKAEKKEATGEGSGFAALPALKNTVLRTAFGIYLGALALGAYKIPGVTLNNNFTFLNNWGDLVLDEYEKVTGKKMTYAQKSEISTPMRTVALAYIKDTNGDAQAALRKGISYYMPKKSAEIQQALESFAKNESIIAFLKTIN